MRRHNLATLAALISFLLLVAINVMDAEALEPISVAAILILFVAIVAMYRTRAADEYVETLWRNGTSLAFVITAALLLAAPFFEGMYDGLMGADRQQDFGLSQHAGLVLIGAFFLGNGWARIRGTV